ncbi:MAG: hypothetical protein PUD86_06800 [Methanobacteriaceae archaeon]|nr:hypothetical protein [Methanobacteriaceae archaeon]
MNKQKSIIVVLSVIIVILIICVAMFALPTFKEESKLAIVDKTIDEGGKLVVVLTDTHGIGLPDATINIKLTDEDGITIEEDVTTNDKGKAKLKVEEKGKYSVECTFDGKGKYAASSLSDNIKVKKVSTKTVSEKKTSNFDSVSGLSEDGYSYYPEYGPAVDSLGTTREDAIANNWHYIPQTIDGQNAGLYVPYDSNAGCYHT